ncbi:MAG: hypothetical protein ABIH91_04635 [Candidatus Omnitrophota bacterium]
MNRNGSIRLLVLIVLFVISLAAAVGVFYLYQKEHAQNVQLQAQIMELENRQRQTVSQLEESKKVATELQLKLQEAESKADSLAGELLTEKSAHEETFNKLGQITAELSEQQLLRKDLEKRLNQVQEDSKKINEQIKIMQQQKIDLETKIKDLETGAGGVELGKVIVSPEASEPAIDAAPAQAKLADEKINAPVTKVAKVAKKDQPSLAKGQEGKVIIVNKEFNFAVINLGSKDHVSIGDEFLVSRLGKTIGDLKVEKVHEAMSAAGFAAELKDLIKENDQVTQKTK